MKKVLPPGMTLLEEIDAFYRQQKSNGGIIERLGHLEYRMWGFIKRIARRKKETVNHGPPKPL